ncbi:Eco57I restriction-modification methylase domain-containing protein [Marinicauda sp. Alg238-R41]|uniref:Eco57I restriction-modification methylase domain-containing protein n=1 Tax=Marinicauda sp. Alg238-R41 TaxID=2993447 RepID=UPI0022E32784|nr:DNA methyltransferase [Marinicauda sp. Alg238-R41]
MTKTYQPLFSDSYLHAALADEYAMFKGSEAEKSLITTLINWQNRAQNLTETQEEGAFLDSFFKGVWGYYANGETKAGEGFTCYPKFRVAGAGQSGGSGEADLALGWFGREEDNIPPIPQVLCEFKDIRSNLDARQNRKGNTRSPVKQCGDYLREAGKELYGNEAIQPTWGIVTDMNEFRLYWRNRMPSQYQRFVIRTTTGDDVVSLLAQTEEASFQRFLFMKLFHSDMLLTTGGDSPLLKLLHKQWVLEKEIENDFYKEYKAYRERVYNALVAYNDDFDGTRGRLVRLAQKLIDRCIFVLFCEDMGEALSFPPNALRDFLKEFSKADWYDPNAQDVWNKLKELFRAMDQGEKFLDKRINRFNGGLFEADKELDGLFIPNHVFCEKLQGESAETIKQHPRTLLYLSAVYNFGTSGTGENAITLYTLGRIFEQSITELEAMEAEAEGRVSLTEIEKRKRDGVYYTPEWVVQHIVEETIGTRLQEIRDALGWSIEIEGDDGYVRKQKNLPPSSRSQKFNAHVDAVKAYKERLNNFKVCDPACGSGAFLIHVLEYLLKERLKVTAEIGRVTRQGEELFEANTEQEIREILSRNIYGVDINPSSIEITKLALWLHTAKPDQALCDLDENIVDGNSLIGPEFGNFKQLSLLSADKQEEINVFDWEATFPKVFDDKNPDGPGFDCIVGNPPYVKLQNFRKKYAEMADFLRNGKNEDGTPVYQSTQKSNFDLFLPFIEKAIHLLNSRGRMGYIAPSLWRYNEYGEGLRKFLHDGKHLDRWIDFGSYQVFEAATTYTALQFYSNTPKDEVRFVYAHDGAVSDTPDWDDQNWRMPYDQLPRTEPWVFVPGHERKLIRRLQEACVPLNDSKVSTIFVGVQTNANKIYHLKRIGNDTYLYEPDKDVAIEVAVEDKIMRPLVSGTEAKRYVSPDGEKRILFPYRVKGADYSLFTEIEMKKWFPNAWKYLKSVEEELRARGNGEVDNDEKWWGWIYLKNIDKQGLPKLMVAQTVPEMRVSPDEGGDYCLDNVRVNGILPAHQQDFYYLLGILNSHLVNWVFRRIAKPKDNGFFEANRQFIAPLPMPKASAAQKQDIDDRARTLQDLHTKRRDKLKALEKRYSACAVKKRSEDWLFPQVGALDHWKAEAPDDMQAREKTKWAKEQRKLKLEECLEHIEARLSPSSELEARYDDGELRFLVDGVLVIENVYVNDADGQHILTYWLHLARTLSITEKFKAKTLADKLRTTPMTGNADLSAQINDLSNDIDGLNRDIRAREIALNEAVYEIYGLSDEDRAIVEGMA